MAWDVPSFYIPVQVSQGQQIASMADRLMGAYDKGQASRRQQDVLDARKSVASEPPQMNADGTPNYMGYAQRLLGAGDIQGASMFQNLAQTQENMAYRRSRDASEDTWRQQTFQAGRQDAAANQDFRNRSLGIQERAATDKPPATTTTYDDRGQEQRAQWNPATQKWEPIGSPKQPTRPPLPAKTVGDLSSAGEAVTNQDRLGSGFDPQFAGQPVTGDLNNWLGRTFGGGNQSQAEWWQDYQRQRNVIRHQLFGSALTATEKGEFEKADINPGMSPQVIQANLEKQKAASVRAARKLAETYIRMGYPPDVVEAAIGVPLQQLGVGQPDPNSAKDQSRPPSASTAAPSGPAEGQTATNPNTGERVVFRGGEWVPYGQ